MEVVKDAPVGLWEHMWFCYQEHEKEQANANLIAGWMDMGATISDMVNYHIDMLAEGEAKDAGY